jgi:hypothetical protein
VGTEMAALTAAAAMATDTIELEDESRMVIPFPLQRATANKVRLQRNSPANHPRDRRHRTGAQNGSRTSRTGSPFTYSSLRSSGIGGMPTTVGTDFVLFPNVSHAAVPPAPAKIAVAMMAAFHTERLRSRCPFARPASCAASAPGSTAVTPLRSVARKVSHQAGKPCELLH